LYSFAHFELIERDVQMTGHILLQLLHTVEKKM